MPVYYGGSKMLANWTWKNLMTKILWYFSTMEKINSRCAYLSAEFRLLLWQVSFEAGPPLHYWGTTREQLVRGTGMTRDCFSQDAIAFPFQKNNSFSPTKTLTGTQSRSIAFRNPWQPEKPSTTSQRSDRVKTPPMTGTLFPLQNR